MPIGLGLQELAAEPRHEGQGQRVDGIEATPCYARRTAGGVQEPSSTAAFGQ
jgi:hypothetical protein